MDLALDVPAHLRELVVRQDYDRYTQEDQAVWRFVLLQTYARQLTTAHPAYAQGFAAAGISVEHIPRIEQMSECLGRFGFRAVCVDGFIPPRAFQAFQARGLLPIAADIRSAQHLAYTPAPDIIHEAAGHAPFLAEPDYARYLRRIGQVGETAFATRSDREAYAAIYTLSEVKEDPASTPEQIERAQAAVLNATRPSAQPSEAALLARLYWWTVEYGLVGTPSDYRLYGAGLLSSLGEGHFCHEPGIRKLPLSAACIDVDYDITRAQPQLFVAESFAQLEHVLDEVACKLAHRVGGMHALLTAQTSEEIATLELDSGLQLSGVVSGSEEDRGQAILVQLSGPCALSGGAGGALESLGTGYVLPLGALSDGSSLSALTSDRLRRAKGEGGQLELELQSGVRVRGAVDHVDEHDGRVRSIVFDGCEIVRGERVLLQTRARYLLPLAHTVRTARAGAPDAFFPPTLASQLTVPKPRAFAPDHRELLHLYERATQAWQNLAGAQVTREFEQIRAGLDALCPDDWLLRWNLLESLLKLGEQGDLSRRLHSDLERLEIRFAHREPIATGLSYLRGLIASSQPPVNEGNEGVAS